MQTILGANGIIAVEMSKVLPAHTDKIRQVSRHPRKVNDSDELFAADITDPEQVRRAVAGSEVVYLTAGLDYNIKVWREKWPRIMRNVIDACREANARLLFFDNVYLYGKVDGPMTESTPVKPSSEKGKVRARIADMLIEAVELGEIQGLIARAPDFYGPGTPNSFVNITIFENLAKGKKAQVFLDDSLKHSLIFTPDAGRATALLGNTESAFNQVWHLPTYPDPPTARELVQMAAAAFEVAPRYIVLKKWMLQAIGLFVPVIRESVEMLYQNEYEYRFDSSKFDQAFDFRTTSYEEGVRLTAESMKNP